MTAIGPYEVTGDLGRGGMGVVVRARGPDGREVAVKLVARALAKPGALERFQREARLQARFGEAEGFVPVLDAGETPEGLYIVMPIIPGGTLRDKLNGGPLAIDDALELVKKISVAVGRAHAAGIVHRDLKPDNVLFTAGRRPLVADLGLAKHFRRDVSGASLSVALSRTGEVRGTAGYMSPEQIGDSASVGPPADVFSLGAILYECLAGAPPFTGGSMLELLAMTETGSYEKLAKVRPDAPSWVESVIARALAHDPRDRFADGASLARAIEEKGWKRSRAPLAGGVAVVAIAAASIFVVARRSPEPASCESVSAAPAAPAAPAPPARHAIAPEILAGARRLDPVALERARGAADVDAQLDRALADGVVAARKRSWSAVARGLEAVEKSGAPHGDLFRDAALAAVGDGVRELLPKKDFDGALELANDAGRLRLRFPRGHDTDALLDEFYKGVIGEPPTVPRERWLEVILAFLRLDADIHPPHLDVVTADMSPPAARKPDVFDTYLRWRLEAHFHKTDKAPWLVMAERCVRILDAPEIGPRLRSTMILHTSVALADERWARLKKAVALDPESALRHYEVARELAKNGRPMEAIEEVRAALALWKSQKPMLSVAHQFGDDCEEKIQELSRGEFWTEH